MFLVSMADIIGSYERLPNDAVRAVAVAKRREYTMMPNMKRHGADMLWKVSTYEERDMVQTCCEK